MANVSQIQDGGQIYSFNDAVAATINANNINLNEQAETLLNTTIENLNTEVTQLERRITAIENRITALENL